MNMNGGLVMPVKPILRPQRCENCGACGPMEDPNTLHCHLELKLVMVPTQQGPQAISIFPKVEPWWWCVKWKPKVEQVGSMDQATTHVSNDT